MLTKWNEKEKKYELTDQMSMEDLVNELGAIEHGGRCVEIPFLNYGTIIMERTPDPAYPGAYIAFRPAGRIEELDLALVEGVTEENCQSMRGGETPGDLRVMAWGNPWSEEYTRKDVVRFTEVIKAMESASPAELEIYRTEDEIRQYKDDLKYWSNACGELHHHGEYDISYNELPEELKVAYDNFWTEGAGSYCYLAEYKGVNGIALTNEYHEYTCEGKPDEVNNFYWAEETAGKLAGDVLYGSGCTVILAKACGFPGASEAPDDDPASELTVFIPCDKLGKYFEKMINWLDKNAYKPDAA